jgi:hypothetical protein
VAPEVAPQSRRHERKSFALYWPERDAVLCGTLNQSAAKGVFSELRPVAALVPDVLRALSTSLPHGSGG